MVFNSGNKKRQQRGQGVVHISNLFLKYQNTLVAPQKVVVDAFCILLKEEFKITISKTQCSYNPNAKILSLRVSGMIKSEVLLKKKMVLKKMAEVVGVQNTPKEIL